MRWPVNPHEGKTINQRAGCGKPARPVRRGGRPNSIGLPYLYRNFQYLLIIHIPLVLTATLIPLAGYPLLYLPIHIVWLEILIHPTAMLVFQETAAKKLVRRSHTAGKATFFTATQWTMLLLTGLVIAAVTITGICEWFGKCIAVVAR